MALSRSGWRDPGESVWVFDRKQPVETKRQPMKGIPMPKKGIMNFTQCERRNHCRSAGETNAVRAGHMRASGTAMG